MKRLIAALAILLLPGTALAGSWTNTTGAQEASAVQTVTSTWTFDTVLGYSPDLDISQCTGGVTYSFDASTADASTDATIELQECDRITPATPVQSCTSVSTAINTDTNGASIQLPIYGDVLKIRALTPTTGGDTAQVVVTCKRPITQDLTTLGLADGSVTPVKLGSAGAGAANRTITYDSAGTPSTAQTLLPSTSVMLLDGSQSMTGNMNLGSHQIVSPGAIAFSQAKTNDWHVLHGYVSSATTTSLTDTHKSFTTNAYSTNYCVRIISGAGSSATCTDITSNTATALSVAAWPSGTPDTTSVYEIIYQPGSIQQALDYFASLVHYYLMNQRQVEDYNTGSTTTSGLQEAVNDCFSSVMLPTCKVILPPAYSPVLLTSTVTIGSLTNSASSTAGPIIVGQGSGQVSGSNAYAGSVIAWSGAAGGTMIRVLGTYNFQMRDTLLWGCWQNNAANSAGIMVEIQGWSTAPSHITTFHNVVEDGCQAATAAASPIGYYAHSYQNTNPIAFGPAAVSSATATTLVAAGTQGWSGQFVNTCGPGGTSACYVQILSGSGMNLVRQITASSASTLTLASPPTSWYETPDSTSTFQVVSVNTTDANDFSGQADFITWGGGSSSRHVRDCIRIFSSQSLNNLETDFECSYRHYGTAVFSGEVTARDGYFGADTGAKASLVCHNQFGSGTPGCGQGRIIGNHFEVPTGDFVLIDSDPGYTSNKFYGGEITGNTFSVQGDPSPSNTASDETVIKVDGYSQYRIESNRVQPISSTYGAAVYLGSVSGTRVAHIFRGNTFINLYPSGAPIVTLAGSAAIDAVFTDANGYFNDANLNGTRDAGELSFASSSGVSTHGVAFWGDGSASFDTGTEVCAAHGMTCKEARTFSAIGTPLTNCTTTSSGAALLAECY